MAGVEDTVSDKWDPALESAVIASSSADEEANEAGSVIRKTKRRRKETNNGKCSSREDEPKQENEQNKNKCSSREDEPVIVKQSCTEQDISGREKVTCVRGPRMDRHTFLQRYPYIVAGAGQFLPNMRTPISQNVIADCFTFVSPTKLDALEAEWIKYCREDCQTDIQRSAFVSKYTELFQLSQGAFKQPANSDNTRKHWVKKRSEFASKYPLVNAGLNDYTCLQQNDMKDIRLDYLMSTAEDQLRELEAEHASFYEIRFRLANDALLIREKQTNLLHTGTKAYRKYQKSFTKAV